ncbi:hypothetical protein GGP85_002897 [Salinibacter ruber]|uniref:hypothetical protein n=1 Tax=Salinibacter ruber TaxID=146919 RepID=UPI00216709C8|nr:hypothetical protein [Salinibacter ruber]MCS3827427.1 hypothetical protein [Salinibacter ruber]
MTIQNAQLLQSQEALQILADTKLGGVHALQLKSIMADVEDRMRHLQEVREDLAGRDDLTEEEANEEWRSVLEDDLEMDHEPLPRKAFEGVQISAGDLIALDWLIADEGPDHE